MKTTLSRLRNALQKYGFLGFSKKLLRRVGGSVFAVLDPLPLLSLRKLQRELAQMLSAERIRVVLWRSSFGYQTPLYQRPQHMARALAQLGCLVVYEAVPGLDRCRTLREIEPGLWLYNFSHPLLRLLLMHALTRWPHPKYLQLYSTDWKLSAKDLKRYLAHGFRIVYEYVDQLSPALSGTKTLPARVAEKYAYVMAHPEIYVVTTAKRLETDVLEKRGSARLIASSNGVDYAFFQAWGRHRFEPAFQRILDLKKPVVCYYGALAVWVDYALLRAIAADGRYSVVLIGVKYDGSFDRELHGEENLFFLGARDYAVLKYYARAADVLILPFLLNDVTHATSPVKLFEYMALHKPIVSTEIDEARRYRSVLRAADHKSFLHQLEHALSLAHDESYLALLDREARENDWHEKAMDILRGTAKP